jgi:hypothetical protein
VNQFPLVGVFMKGQEVWGNREKKARIEPGICVRNFAWRAELQPRVHTSLFKFKQSRSKVPVSTIKEPLCRTSISVAERPPAGTC